MRSSRSVACFLIRLHRSIVNSVLDEFSIDVRELIMADNITAINKPRKPVSQYRQVKVYMYQCYNDCKMTRYSQTCE